MSFYALALLHIEVKERIIKTPLMGRWGKSCHSLRPMDTSMSLTEMDTSPQVLIAMGRMEALQRELMAGTVCRQTAQATVVVVPGSKSLSNRYLILAALGSEPSAFR